MFSFCLKKKKKNRKKFQKWQTRGFSSYEGLFKGSNSSLPSFDRLCELHSKSFCLDMWTVAAASWMINFGLHHMFFFTHFFYFIWNGRRKKKKFPLFDHVKRCTVLVKSLDSPCKLNVLSLVSWLQTLQFSLKAPKLCRKQWKCKMTQTHFIFKLNEPVFLRSTIPYILAHMFDVHAFDWECMCQCDFEILGVSEVMKAAGESVWLKWPPAGSLRSLQAQICNSGWPRRADAVRWRRTRCLIKAL